MHRDHPVKLVQNYRMNVKHDINSFSIIVRHVAAGAPTGNNA